MAILAIDLAEPAVERFQGFVDHRANRPHWMMGCDSLFEGSAAEQLVLLEVFAAHITKTSTPFSRSLVWSEFQQPASSWSTYDLPLLLWAALSSAFMYPMLYAKPCPPIAGK